jgi:hypothetical protein
MGFNLPGRRFFCLMIAPLFPAAIQDAVWTVVSKHPLAGVHKASSRNDNHPSSLSPAPSRSPTGSHRLD